MTAEPLDDTPPPRRKLVTLDRLTSLGIAVWLLGVQAAWTVFLAWVGLRLLNVAG
jgi:hypothetical protein